MHQLSAKILAVLRQCLPPSLERAYILSCKMLGVTFLYPLMSQHNYLTLCLSTLNENSTRKTSDRDIWGQRQAEGGGECITMDQCVRRYNRMCCVTLRWLVFLCRPHKTESVPEVSKQGLMWEEEAVTHCLLASACCSGLCCVTSFRFLALVLLVGVKVLLASTGKYYCWSTAGYWKLYWDDKLTEENEEKEGGQILQVRETK